MVKIGKDAVGGSDVLRTKPKRVSRPSKEAEVSKTDKDLDAATRESFLTDEDERERKIREFIPKKEETAKEASKEDYDSKTTRRGRKKID